MTVKTSAKIGGHGKSSHGTLFYGKNFTVVGNPKEELKTGTMHAMLDQLGLAIDDLKNL